MQNRILGEAAESLSDRLRSGAAKVKGAKARFSENPFREDMTLRGAADARPELPFQESQARAQQAEAIVNRAKSEGRALTQEESAFIERAPGGYPEMKIGQGQGRGFVMSGEAAQAMSDSRPYGRRMLRADQPDLGLGPVAQRSLSAEVAGTVPTGSVNETLTDIYTSQQGGMGSPIDLPNEYVGLSPDIIRQRLAQSGGENIVDTRGIPYRQESRQGYGYKGSPYKNLDPIPSEDRANLTGNPMDEYLTQFSRQQTGPNPEALAAAQDLLDRGANVALPYGARIGTFMDEPVVLPDRVGNELTIDTLGGSELGRRLRQSANLQPIFDAPTDRVALTRGSNQGALALENGVVSVIPGLDRGGAFTRQPLSFARKLEQLQSIPVARPQQVDFREAANQGRSQADAVARARSAQLDQSLMAQNAELTGSPTTNFIVRDVNPAEFYLYNAQPETQGRLPDAMLGLTRPYSYEPSNSLVEIGFSDRVKPVTIPANQVGLGIDINNKSPYQRAAVVRREPSVDALGIIRTPRNIPVDPITPIDLDLPGVRYAEKSGLQANTTPELAIAEDRRSAARMRAIAELEQSAVDKYLSAPREGLSPDMQRRADNAYNAIVQSDVYDQSAANMANAMRVVNEQTAPHEMVRLARLGAPLPFTQSVDELNQIVLPGVPLRSGGKALTTRTGVLPSTVPSEVTPALGLSPGGIGRGEEMPFEEAIEIMKPYQRQGAADQVLRLPVTPTVAPEQTQLSKRLRLAQSVGSPESASIMSDPALGLYKAIAQTDPNMKLNEIRRGVQYTMVPVGDQGQGYKIRLDNPGQPVIDPSTGQRMTWQGQPVVTYDPQGQIAPVEVAVRPRASRAQIRDEETAQRAQAIQEGYVFRPTSDPYDQVPLTGDDLSEMRGGLSAKAALDARRHNLVRELSGLPPVNPVTLARQTARTGVSPSALSYELIQAPPAQGGVMVWGNDDFGYGRYVAGRLPSSGPTIQIQSGGMLNDAMTEPLPARTMRPTIRQVPATTPLARQAPAQKPSEIQPARIEGRSDLDWQRSPSFRFPANVWRGTQGL